MSDAYYFEHDDLDFCFEKTGEGVPFVFLHGLGGNLAQPFGMLVPPPGICLICMDARAHGRTRPLGDPEKVKLSVMADDVGALLDHLGLVRAVVGGISMGAAVALNFALRFPARAAGLVLVRPAWLDAPRPENTRVFSHIAKLLRELGAREGMEAFQRSEVYAELRRESPDCAASACGQFLEPRAVEAVVRLEQISQDAPSGSWPAAWTRFTLSSTGRFWPEKFPGRSSWN
jgi:pimeloyl-ACP methyl ester carboxylesterase